MLDLSDIHEEESLHEEHVEADDGEMITESGGSSSMPTTSASDKEDGVNDLGICINLSNLIQVPKPAVRFTVSIDRSLIDLLNVMPSSICSTCSSLSLSGPSASNLSNTITTMATAIPAVAVVATTCTVTPPPTVAAAAATATTTTTAGTITTATITTTTTTTTAGSTITTITTITASPTPAFTTPAAISSSTSTCVRPAYPKFGLYQFTEPVGPTRVLPASASAIKFFMQLFDEDLFQHIVDQTNLYASQMPTRSPRYGWYDTTVPEMKAFIGVLLLMGIHQLPCLADYWSTHNYLGVPSIAAVFPANRFNHLLASIHFNDNSAAKPCGHPGYDKLYKVRPIIDSILQKCLMLYKPHRENSIDEAMVGFKGRSSLKQYIPSKPTKRGFKVWVRCDSRNGFTCCFQVYTGKVGDTAEKNVGARVVKDVSNDVLDKGYHLYFDNYFSSPSLLSDLLERDTYCIGTVRVNRKHFPQFGKRNVKNLERGQSLSREVLGDKVHCFVWKDKKPVAFVNTICDVRDFAAVRRKQSDGSIIVVECPSAVVLYNENMGGVDLADQKRKMYSASRKSKVKWYMRLFYYLLDVVVVNAHILESDSPFHLPTRTIGKKRSMNLEHKKLLC